MYERGHMLNSTIDKCNALFEKAARQRHIVIFRESLQKLLVFWVCIGICLLLAKYATSYPMGQLSSIAIMIMMASYIYCISGGIAKSLGASGSACGLAAVFVCFLCSYQTLIDKPLRDYAIWLLLSIVLGELYGFLSRFRFDNRLMPHQAEGYLSELFPCIGTMLLGMFIGFLSPLFFPLIRSVFLWIAHGIDSLVAVVVLVVVTAVGKLYFPQLPKIVRAVIRPFWIYMSLANLYYFFHKGAYPFITTEAFYHWFVWVGGAGGGLGLAIDLLVLNRSKDRFTGLKCVQETLFNLDERVMDEVIVKNRKKLAIPYISVPVITAVIMYLATAWGYLKPSRLLSPWMLPGPLGGWLATGLDGWAILASLICILISMLVYLPFVISICKGEKA